MLLLNIHWASAGNNKTIMLNFFSEQISLNYNEDIEKITLLPDMDEETFERYYFDLDKSGYYIILNNLFHYKRDLELNDWVYYLLIHTCAKAIYAQQDENYRTLFCWFMLHKSGYTVQLNYTESEALLSVYTRDKVFALPVREEGNGWFVNITNPDEIFKDGTSKRAKMKLIAQKAAVKINKPGRPFLFEFGKLPKLNNPKIMEKKLSFIHDNQLYQYDVRIDGNYLSLMYYYPELTLYQHAQIDLSASARATLLYPLKKTVENKSPYESIRLLLSFTRQAMLYDTDQNAYNRENLMFSPEETLFYKYSDCEDRSALFYYLVREILGLDVILLDFPTHASVAVALDKPYGDNPINYKGKIYSICDPTGPGNHLKPGDFPEGLENVEFKILEE